MTDYKLVPVEPTDEMATAAMNAEIHANSVYGEPAAFSDIWRAMLSAAPAVQGELAGVAITMPGTTGITVAVFDAVNVPPGTQVYTAPQPAEQERFKRFNGQECWMWAGDGSDRLETLTRPVVITPADLMAIINRVAPAPDVTGLVEALSESLKGIEIPSVLTPPRTEFFKAGVHAAVNRLNTVLAAHRRQGDEA